MGRGLCPLTARSRSHCLPTSDPAAAVTQNQPRGPLTAGPGPFLLFSARKT